MAQADSAETESGRRRCALARPSSALERHCIAGRDVGFAESGFRPTDFGRAPVCPQRAGIILDLDDRYSKCSLTVSAS